MKREAVDSSSLASIGYDADSRTLEIEFRSGKVYRYLEVSPMEYEGLVAAKSKGRFFNTRISPRFEFERL